VSLPAFGVADAEARTEKEILAALPGAQVRILEIRRASEHPRIVDEFLVSYWIGVDVMVEAANEESARRIALTAGRDLLRGSRFGRTAWDRAELRGSIAGR